MTHICVGKLTIIGSDNGLSPGRRQAIIWINAGILLIWPLGKNFSEIYIEIFTFSFKKMRLKVSFAKWRTFCLGLNVLICPQAVLVPLHKVPGCDFPWHYSDVTWVLRHLRSLVTRVTWLFRCLKSPTTQLFVQQLVEVNNKRTDTSTLLDLFAH